MHIQYSLPISRFSISPKQKFRIFDFLSRKFSRDSFIFMINSNIGFCHYGLFAIAFDKGRQGRLSDKGCTSRSTSSIGQFLWSIALN